MSDIWPEVPRAIQDPFDETEAILTNGKRGVAVYYTGSEETLLEQGTLLGWADPDWFRLGGSKKE